MNWVEWVFTALLFTATVRALTTAWRKQVEGAIEPELPEAERLILREDQEHWWMACFINGLLLSIGVVAIISPDTHTEPTFVQLYASYAFVAFALMLNVRIERHGYYYRRRNGINIWGGRLKGTGHDG